MTGKLELADEFVSFGRTIYNRGHPSELQQLVQAVVFFGQMLHHRQYISGTDGTLSVRVGSDRALATCSEICKRFLTPDDLVLVDLAGNQLSGSRKPSSELHHHLSIYKRRSDVNAVVHAYPCSAMGLASDGLDLTEAVCSELVLTLDEVPLARYAPSGSPELHESLNSLIEKHDAILLEHRGVVTCGNTLDRAYMNMEVVEHCARIALVARTLGGCKTLDAAAVSRLRAQKSKRCL